MEQLICVTCIVEAKLAVLVDPEGPVPGVRRAIAILGGQTTCAEHIVVKQQSALTAPNGSPLTVPGH